jgi:alpha-1,3-rhamnosyltransferase
MLVSVAIIAYNSSEFIIELLDSLYRQTYKNIEVIISDDCSKDNTVEVCREWGTKHAQRFVRFEILEAKVNQGVCANSNKVIKECRGEWIKYIAGDDVFPDNAIQEYVEYILSHPECEICFAKMKPFGEDDEANASSEQYLELLYKSIKLPTKRQQYLKALHQHILPGPGLFYRSDFFSRIGRYNPQYRNAEEYDFEIRVFRESHVQFIDKYLVHWRVHKKSLCHSKGDEAFKCDYNLFFNVLRPLLIEEGMYLDAIIRACNYRLLSLKRNIFKGEK